MPPSMLKAKHGGSRKARGESRKVRGERWVCSEVRGERRV